MNYSNYRITLDVRKTVSNVQLTAKKGDVGRRIYITLSDKGKPCEIADGSYSVFAGVKPDGTLLYNKTTIENNTIIYEMTQQTTAVAGLVECEVKLFDSMSNLLTSPKLTILVDDVVVPDEEIVSKDEVTALAELVVDARDVIDRGNQVIESSNEAVQSANEAVQSANEAVQSANDAVQSANDAATGANQAAESANAASIQATQAAGAANTAITNANNAADVARAATEETNTARENLMQAGGEILNSLSKATYAEVVECTAVGQMVTANDASNQQLRGLTVYGKTTQSSTPSPESPVPLESVGDSGSVGLTVTGKNLWHRKDITISKNGAIKFANPLEPGIYTLSLECTSTDTDYDTCRIGFEGGAKDGDSVNVSFTRGSRVSRTVTLYNRSTALNFSASASNSPATGDTAKFTNIQVEAGSIATDYEPYTAQTLTIQTPNGLPGIPVSVDGNYTDESGRQWYCDEVDYTRGVYVKRTHRVEINSTSSKTLLTVRTNSVRLIYPNNPNALPSNPYAQYCNRLTCGKAYGEDIVSFVAAIDNTGSLIVSLPLSAGSTKEAVGDYLAEHPLDIIYPLETPIETPLSAEEMAQYAALHTNKPNTTISNYAGAGMEVSYVADTKAYIDNKFTELQNAILATGANI